MSNISHDMQRLISNFFSLSVLQSLNMFLPLVTLPYLVRSLGVETFGIIAFTLSIIMFFNIIVSFGFELSATRQISMNTGNSQKISDIFSSVMTIKLVLLVASLLVLILLIICIEEVSNHASLYLVTFGLVIGNMLFPSWLFQGMEKMKYITYINVITKTIITGLIFVFVQNKNDFMYVPMLNSLAAIISGLASLWLAFKVFDISFVIPTNENIKKQIRESYYFFLSRVANDGSRYFATTIIGLNFGNVLVGYFSIVEKLFYALISVGGIVSQTIFPFMSRVKDINIYKKILSITMCISALVIIITMHFNKFLLMFLFDIQNEILSDIFNIVFSGAIFGILSSMIGYPLLAAFGFVKPANKSLIYASIIYVLYITAATAFKADIYVVSFAITLYMITGLFFRLYYVQKYMVKGKYI